MNRTLTAMAAVVLVAHGLIHFLGTAVYLRLAELDEMPSRIKRPAAGALS